MKMNGRSGGIIIIGTEVVDFIDNAIHEQHIVHRDLKPATIYITKTGEATGSFHVLTHMPKIPFLPFYPYNFLRNPH